MSYLGRSAKLSLKAQEKVSFLATAGQTSKTGLSYTPSFVEVYVNGVLLTDTTDFTATNGNSVTFTVALLLNDEVTVISLKTFTVADHYNKTEVDTLLAAKSLAGLSDTTVSASNPAVNTNPSSGLGHVWFNKTTGDSYICTSATTDDNVWTNIGLGTNSIESTYPTELLCVGGGGSGGNGIGGGGGAGGYRTSEAITLVLGTVYTVTVGGGASAAVAQSNASGSAGSASSISGSGITTVTSAGGGYGAGYNLAGGNGGSGGGGSLFGSNSGLVAGAGGNGNTPSTSPVQGFGGGGSFHSGANTSAGGGGGSSSVGANGASENGGAGGAGTVNSITGSSVTYAGGGGGSTHSSTTNNSSGGSGGGGQGGNSQQNGTSGNGTANTGGGGGGDGYYTPQNGASGAGGSGVVILKIHTGNYSGTTSGSPTVSTSGYYTIIKFTGSGTYTG